MQLATIIGARPQFIKAVPVSHAIDRHNQENPSCAIREILVHTGQHYDYGMSKIFFEQLGLREPDFHLGVGSGTHAYQTGEMLKCIEEVLLKEKPDAVLVYGDTNSTLAGALASAKLHITVGHVEAGLRSFNREMPEEYNRILTDHCSDLLFCPTQTAVNNLTHEGIDGGVHLVGDTMCDAVLQFTEMARHQSMILDHLGLSPQSYLLATVHRPYNVDIPENLGNILAAFAEIHEPIVFPVHPRTRRKICELNGAVDVPLSRCDVKMIDPVGYLDMLVLERNARLILTDSGGVQKEAYCLGVPCVTLRPETEWVETVEEGWNVVVGNERKKIVEGAANIHPSSERKNIYGNGHASEKILRVIIDLFLVGD